MPRIPDTQINKQRVALMPEAWQAIATGERPLSELDDEEVFQGRLRGSDGRLCPRPAFYPQNFLDEQVKRSLTWSHDQIRMGVHDAINVFRTIMNDDTVAPADRLRAATFFADRFLGKDVQRVLVAAEDPVETLFRAILADPQGLESKALSAEDRELLG